MRRHPLIAELAERRVEAGLTQTDLARRLSRTQRAISHFESDPGGRQLLVVEEVARGLGLRLALVPLTDQQTQQRPTPQHTNRYREEHP